MSDLVQVDEEGRVTLARGRHVVPPSISEGEARELTERIRGQAESLWELLLEAYERKAWTALGYTRWQDYISGEFHHSHMWSYRLLLQGKVIREIEAASGVTNWLHGISEFAAREIGPVLGQVTDEIRERIATGEDPEAAVQEAVAAGRAQTKAKAAQAAAKANAERDGIIVTSGNAPAVAIQKAMDTLDAMRVLFRSISLDELPDDAPADQWLREIDQATKTLRTLRQNIRSRYGVS